MNPKSKPLLFFFYESMQFVEVETVGGIDLLYYKKL